MTQAVRSRESGLTLVEVLVALAIFAIIGVAGMSILNTTVRVKHSTEGRLERLARIDRAFLVVGRDLLQMAPGGVILNDSEFRFLRAGADAPSPVSYALTDGTLLRQLDAGGRTVDQRLLDDVDTLGWRLMTSARQWQDSWPRADGGASVPVAAELTLTLRLDGVDEVSDLKRLFALPGGAVR
ncbi:type II secretion system protein GspJ [Pseudooceanicola sp. MF1-13]|uniref:type II secretion system protein GspJ n=1 Tax=Pseudooceanicola sp. MF1-13 TaxID=3379095 RepID=UPI003892ACAC